MKDNILYTLLGTALLTSYLIYLKPKTSCKNQLTQTDCQYQDQSNQTDDNMQSIIFESTIVQDENVDSTEGVFLVSSQLTNSSDNSEIDWKSVSEGLE